jgi:adenosylmethionine-8-amino-7-oxononanoate aminotransferase
MNDNELPQSKLLELCSEYTLRTPDYSQPPILIRGKDTYAWDINGKQYLDLGSGQMCVSEVE